jgi:ketol-acid reductoisomerase
MQRPGAPVPSKLHVRGSYRMNHLVPTLIAGVQDPTGHLAGRQTAVDTGMATGTSPAVCAGHQPSGVGGRSGSSGRSIR